MSDSPNPPNRDCDECGHGPCIFAQFRDEFIISELWIGERNNIDSTVEDDDIRARTLRKKLYTSFARFNGVIWKRQKHPTCVVTGIREMYPSPCYMGFKRKRNEEDECDATDINGKKQKGLKFVKIMEGEYKVKDMA